MNGNIEKNIELEKTDLFKNYTNHVKEIETLDKNTKKKICTEYSFFVDNQKYNKLLNYSRKDNNLDNNIIKRLYGNEVTLSVSRLETLKKCPFLYYSKYILALKPKKEYKLSKMDMGSIMHEVLEKVSRDITAKKIKWQDIVDNYEIQLKIKQTIDIIIEDIIFKKYNNYSESIRIEVLKINLKNSMFNVVINIANSIIQSEFVPLGYEIEFEDKTMFAPIELNLADGRKILLRGKIDRVDIAKIENRSYLRIVDYKSSIKDLSLNDIKQGISLQLMTYMAALINNKEKITKDDQLLPAALNYFTLNTSVINLTNYEKDEQALKEKIIKALKFKGIYINDLEILKKLDTNVQNSKLSYINVAITKLSKEKQKYITEKDFVEECSNIKSTLKNISTEIIKGTVTIEPYDQTNCRYCEYKDVCRRKSIV